VKVKDLIVPNESQDLKAQGRESATIPLIHHPIDDDEAESPGDRTVGEVDHRADLGRQRESHPFSHYHSHRENVNHGEVRTSCTTLTIASVAVSTRGWLNTPVCMHRNVW
jgi:hypothetical protein